MKGEDSGTEPVHVWEFDEFRSVVEQGDILYDVDADSHVARIIFNRPEQLNAIPLAGFDYVSTLVKRAERDERVRVIVLEGRGPCFGTGATANELGYYIGYGSGSDGKRAPSQRRRMVPDRDVLFGNLGVEQVIGRCIKPTVAKVHGYCYGGHLQMALSCDLIIAADDAYFVHPAWRYLGPIFNFNLLIEKVGVTKAKEMVMTARPVAADEAEACGLVTKTVPADQLEQWVVDYCTAITTLPTDGLSMGKAMIEMVLDARGAPMGSLSGWVGHGWMTNLRFEPDEWNFLKSRRQYGLTEALERRDDMVPEYFRMAKHRARSRSQGDPQPVDGSAPESSQ
jgi:enoyl-CoA hydratase